MYLRFFFLWIDDLFFNALGYILNPFIVLFAKSDGNLPRWLYYFQTYDATLDGVGKDGSIEPRFVAATRWLRDSSGAPRGRLARYMCRVAWLYRNNAYGFGYFLLGALGPFDLIHRSGNPAATNRYPAVAGSCFEVYEDDEWVQYFHYWKVLPWGSRGKCWEISIGWKLYQGATRAQIVFRVWPFRAFETQA